MADDSEWWRRYWAINCRPNLTIAMVRFPDGYLSGVKGNHMSDFTLSAGCGAWGRGGQWFFVISQIEISKWWRSSVREEWSVDAKWIKTDCGVTKKKLSLWWANQESKGHPQGKKMRGGELISIRHNMRRKTKQQEWSQKNGEHSGNIVLKTCEINTTSAWDHFYEMPCRWNYTWDLVLVTKRCFLFGYRPALGLWRDCAGNMRLKLASQS